MSNMYKIEGTRTQFPLTKSHYLAKGGEGSIYVRGDTAFKIYEDPKDMIPTSKIQELGVLSDRRIIKPEKVVMCGNAPVGYTMKYIKNTYGLTELFNKVFKNRHNISPKAIAGIVGDMRNIVQHVHSHGILLVDLNEMNVLVDKTFKDVYFIDVDSYQTPSHPATAIMESVRDRHVIVKNKLPYWTTNSDWFSFAVITFQLFVGIHPFKGRHPSYTDPANALEMRMRKNISVFNPNVKYPQNAILPFSVIPSAYRDWYEAVFERGHRSAPPLDMDLVTIVSTPIKGPVILRGNHLFHITEIAKLDSDVISIFSSHWIKSMTGDLGRTHVPTMVQLSKDQYYIDGNKATKCIDADCAIGFTKKGTAVAARVDKGKLNLSKVKGRRKISCNVNANAVSSYHGRIYVHTKNDIVEMTLMESSDGTVLASPKTVAQVSASTSLYDGVAVQDLFGQNYVSIFASAGRAYQSHIPQLDGLKVTDAKYDNHVLMVTAVDPAGEYNKFVFRFSDSHMEYDCRQERVATSGGINFISLPTGVVVSITEDGKVELFRNTMDSKLMKVMEDPMIKSNMRLYNHAGDVILTNENRVYKMAMK